MEGGGGEGGGGVGVVSLHGAPVSFPTFTTPAFAEFFRMGRAMEVVLPFEPICNLLISRLRTSVLCEAKVCCSGQPVTLVGTLMLTLQSVPLWRKEFLMGFGLIWRKLDVDKGTCRGITLVCSNALAASTTCSVLSDRGFSPHFSPH